MQSRPVIGVTAAVESAAWTVWREIEVNLSQRTYSERIDEAGGLPILLPASVAGTADPGALLDRLDGVVVAGGADIDPAVYGAEADRLTINTRRKRDEFEIALVRAALERDLPLLGVCRGMQLLNVALGGTLDQHLADAELHLHTPGRFSDHEVRLEPGSLAARAAGTERLTVRSHHHQGIDRLGEGLVASGWAEPGGAIEATELPDRRWALGVLWHTEEEASSAVMRSFTVATAERRVTV
jgi:putative glutamine amidotransferase